MDELKNEPCKIYAQKVQDCLTKNKFDVPKCYSLMNKLEACCQIINYLKTSNFYTSSTVVAYTFKPAFNGGNPGDIAAELGLDINMMKTPMSREKFEALKANLGKLEIERFFDRHVERVAIKNQGVYCWKVQVRPNGQSIHYAEDKNMRQENKKHVPVGHDGPIIPPTEDLEVMKNLSVVDYGPSFHNKGIFLSKIHIGDDGITRLYVEHKSMIKKMREEEYMNKGAFCAQAWYCLNGISILLFRERTAVDMPSDK